ncbi:MAG: hypothetical protein H0T46_07825 [Deltaproteobacteria bacterium]|nr:hypothetical protein [Deltaproteobacteria bacterium]
MKNGTSTTQILVAVLMLVACKQDNGGAKKRTVEDDPKKPVAERAGQPRHTAPSGTIAGKPFAPTVVMLLENSDGGKLGFYSTTDRELRDRQRCEEPMGSASTFELTKYEPITDWQIGKAIASEASGWGATGVDWNAKPKATAKVTLSKKDPTSFTVAGTIEIAGDGWNLTGPFQGDYCPTKSVKREDKPAPLAGQPWTMAPVAATAPPKTPLEAIAAGAAAKIAHVTLREVPYHDGTKRQRFVFYTAMPPQPCMARPEGGHMRVYSHDELVAADKPTVRIDNFSLDLTAVPIAGAALTGNYHHKHGEKRDQIIDADLQVFEPDGYRGWRYSQYYSAALAIDSVSDTEVQARVVLSLPDDGSSMLVGAFTAKRCPAQTE